MKRLILPLSFLTILHLGWAQDIVLKAEFAREDPFVTIGMKTFEPVDVNEDGIPEIPGRGGGSFYLDVTNLHKYRLPLPCDFFYPQDDFDAMVSVMRRQGLAEFVLGCPNHGLDVIDIQTGDYLLSCPECIHKFIADYDLDGLDDIFTGVGSDLIRVYGIATGNPPILPPQDLDIQQVGNDYVITWDQVPSATAYRIEWSSALDGGVRFTRIGYTTGTTFVHKNQVGQEQGYYRVMSEDNGTGVVRMVGASGQGR